MGVAELGLARVGTCHGNGLERFVSGGGAGRRDAPGGQHRGFQELAEGLGALARESRRSKPACEPSSEPASQRASQPASKQASQPASGLAI